MKKADPDELRPGYRRGDLGPGVRGKYLESFRSETNNTSPTDGPLNEQDLEQLCTRGYVKVRAFTAEDAAEMESTIWRRLEMEGVQRDAPATWRKYPGGVSRSVRKSRIFREAMTAEFAAVVDQLLGQGRWYPPKERWSAESLRSCC